MHHCPRCQSDRLIENGSATDKPKKLGTACGYQLTRITPRGKPCTCGSRILISREANIDSGIP
jgi:hypothetical protein